MTQLIIRLIEQQKEIPVWITCGNTVPLTTYLLQRFGNYQLVAIADDQVAQAQNNLLQDLRSHWQTFHLLTFPSGEASKNRHQKAALEDQLFNLGLGRDTVIMAIGGGVTGDLVGYVAATFQRGVPLVQVPTSLLAQVDSSIGGKVGINHPRGKNLIGAFYQPVAVLADVSTLRTLPENEYMNGLAEVIKYAITLSPELRQLLHEHRGAILKRDEEILQEVVRLSMAQKIKVVEADEKESGYRSILNFGHTVGHALEQLSHYKLKHGFAVAEGMRVALRLSHHLVGYPLQMVQFFDQMLDAYGFPVKHLRQYAFEDIWQTILFDKKVRQKQPHFTLMKTPTEPALFVPVTKKELQNVLQNW